MNVRDTMNNTQNDTNKPGDTIESSGEMTPAQVQIRGLSSAEAASRLKEYGPNRIQEKKKSPLLAFLKKFWGPMPWLIELSMFLAFFLGHLTEAVIILVLLCVNAVIGFLNQQSSSKALEALKNRLALKARVVRDGVWQDIDAALLVPGDIIFIKLGDIIPADAKVLSGSLSVDESALTGESLPVDRKEGDEIHSSSVARRGQAICLVMSTGANTFFGKTANLVEKAHPVSHQEQVMLDIVRYTMYFGVAASVFVAVYALALHISFLVTLTFVVTFLIGAVPVALPAVLTIVQATASSEMAEHGALVTRLDAVEDAASISVICFDKTGTITQNKLSVVEVDPAPGFSRDEVLRTAALASSKDNSDLIDAAVVEAATTMLTGSCTQKSYTPFSPETRRTEAIVECDGKTYHVIKGAVPEVLALCVNTDIATRGAIQNEVETFATKGYRTLAVARIPLDDKNPQKGDGVEMPALMGILALADPIRPDSRTMIADLRALGVKPIMLTGDSLAIAKQISIQAGIGQNVVSIKEIDGLSQEEQIQKVTQVDGFAEIFPEDKFRIVSLLQKSGRLVGMTGDGVNDAPALKQAEMGIAVHNATDVAKASASVVLTKDGLGVIVEAIRLSRRTYQRMLTWVINKVTKVVQVLGLLVAGFFMFKDMVISMMGMSLLVFANDFVTMSLATDNAKDAPEPSIWNVKNITLASLGIGVFLVAQGLGAVFLANKTFGLDFAHMQAFVLLMLVFTSQFRVLMVRARGAMWNSAPGKTLLTTTTAACILFLVMGTTGFIIPGLGVRLTGIALAYSLVTTALLDWPKRWLFRMFNVE